MKNITKRSGILFAVLAASTALIDVGSAYAQVEEIIVTARKRSENLQDIPLSITAITAETIDRKGITSLGGVLNLTAGLILDTYSSQNTRVVIRGLSPTRGRPNVAFLQDGVDISSEAVQSGGGGSLLNNTRLFDLERIEIVKGPQSALYGRSAFAGAINYVTKKPGDKFEGRVSADVGNYGKAEVGGSVSGPVVAGKLAIGLNGSAWTHGGFYKNSVTGAKIGGTDGYGVATSFVATPSDTFKVTGRLEYTNDENEIGPFAWAKANSTLTLPTSALGRVISPAVPTATAFTGKVPSSKGLIVTSSPNPRTGLDYEGSAREVFRVTLTGEADLNFATFISQTHYATANTSQSEENSRQGNTNALAFSTIVDLRSDIEMISQEIKLISPSGEKLQWLTGALFWKETVDQDDVGLACLSIPTRPCGPLIAALPAFPALHWGRDTTHYSAYAQVQYALTDQLKISAEARLQSEKLLVNGPLTPRTLDPFGLFGRPVAAFTPVASIPAGDHDGFLTPRFTAEYKLSEITLLYGSVAKAGKPSGVSTTGAASGGFDPELFRFGAETMWVYEVGQKSTFNDGKGKINLDGYYQDFANKQVSTQIVRSNGLLGTRTVNAGGARVYGAELELGYAPTRDLNLNLAYSYIDSKYTNYVTTGAGPGVIATVGNCKVVTLPTVPSPTTTCELDRSGDELENVSRHSLVLSGSYTIPISGDMNWRFDTDVRYQDDRFADTENLLLLPGYWNVDLRAGIETDTWDITAYANNLFNDRTVKTAFPFTDFGTLRVVPFPPPFTVVLNNGLQSGLPDKRQLGLRAKYRF